MTTEERLLFLKEIPIFEETSEKVLTQIAEAASEVQVKKGGTVFWKGDKSSSMFFIYQGMVQVHDKDLVFTKLGPKDFFGEYALIDSRSRSATVTVLEDCMLLEVSQKRFFDIVIIKTDVARGILRSLITRVKYKDILENELVEKNREILEQNKRIEKQNAQLIELNRTRDKFFSIIAHDLRGPFNALMMLSSLLLRDLDILEDDEIKEIIQQISNSSQQQYKLLESLLSWTRIQTGKMNVQSVSFSLDDVVENVITTIELQAANKQIELVYKTSGIYVKADSNLLEFVLRNLLSNALKFTSANGKVEIRVQKESSMAVVAILDNGVGMQPEQINRLFRIEYAESFLGTENEKGSGLGLILCKEFVELNNGTIAIKSEKEKGTEVSFTIPLLDVTNE